MEEHQTSTRAKDLSLVEPSLLNLRGFEQALIRGWSPDPRRQHDKSFIETELTTLREDRSAFLARTISNEIVATAVSNREPQCLVARRFWIWDGGFCGYIALRYLAGTTQLPLHVPGHVGYSVVPWKQGRGYSTQALRLLLPIARKAGLASISIVCNEDNLASKRVIEKAGGVLCRTGTHASDSPTVSKLFFDLPTYL
ncbi:GNAT family N-acetyltransferase [Rhizobium tropici]|uniref:GNAT family N-acetyltransferase n=1 Tax=Rhizobium tropici TaxID=398 RepID=A0A5B0VXC9_RHITR|nr:GNAT family N-acetyltransferase [Rhizobium tropici]KAA1179323.1 GNAT family N-acetyltransferase [Rhizobium tropici]